MKLLALVTTVTMLFFLNGFAYAQNTSDGIEFKPDRLEFPPVAKAKCHSLRIKAVNNSDTPVVDPTFSVDNPTVFSIKRRFRRCPDPLEPGHTCSVFVGFCPLLAQTYEGTLVFSGSDRKIPVTGRGHWQRGS